MVSTSPNLIMTALSNRVNSLALEIQVGVETLSAFDNKRTPKQVLFPLG